MYKMLLSSPRKRGCFCSRTRSPRERVVFPAQAGVFPMSSPSSVFPTKSSPRKRGCFRDLTPRNGAANVFPAQAGVFLSFDESDGVLPGLPRASGGVSQNFQYFQPDQQSSPRKRGCFSRKGDGRQGRGGLPRASGGVSWLPPGIGLRTLSSPRKRGCFLIVTDETGSGAVFPAQAGVFPRASRPMGTRTSLPRASGGVSGTPYRRDRRRVSSPRKRGCFPLSLTAIPSVSVFPAQAGVFLAPLAAEPCWQGLPRASGGVSHWDGTRGSLPESSPRKRGCF